jgi:hypothetical protein
MSGHPSAPPPRGGGGAGPDDDDCGKLRFQTQLASPIPTAVSALAPGDVLTIELQDRGGVRVIAAVNASGQVAGSIVERIQQLLRCLQQGVTYEAVVSAIAGGAVGVLVQPTP